MYVTSIATATFSMPVKQSPKAQIADDQKDIKTLKSFNALLNQEGKTIKKSKMDGDFKQDAIEEIRAERSLVDNKIQQLTADIHDQKNLKNIKNYDGNVGVQAVAVAYGVSYRA
jgi:hypothetical protein